MPSLPTLSTPVIDWCVVGVSGSFAAACIIAAALTSAWRRTSKRSADVKLLHWLWPTRFLLQASAAGYMLVQLLRLTILWGPDGVFKLEAWQAEIICRVFHLAAFGLLEPFFLMVVLIASAVLAGEIKYNGKTRKPNKSIYRGTVLSILPVLTIQALISFFTYVSFYDSLVTVSPNNMKIFLQPYDREHSVCVFPLAGTLTSSLFCLAFLAGSLHFWRQIHRAAINKVIRHRIRLLKFLVAGFYPLSIVLRGVTVFFYPRTLLFELCRLLHVATVVGMVFSVLVVTVWLPVHKTISVYRLSRSKAGSMATYHSGRAELLPLVRHRQSQSNEARSTAAGEDD